MSAHFITPNDVIHESMPWCTVEWLSKPGLTNAQHLLFLRSEFPVGAVHKFHTHPGREEIIYILEGEAEQWVGKEKRICKPGDSIHIPAGMPHSTINIGNQPLHFLAILSPVESELDFTVDVYMDKPWCDLPSGAAGVPDEE